MGRLAKQSEISVAGGSAGNDVNRIFVSAIGTAYKGSDGKNYKRGDFRFVPLVDPRQLGKADTNVEFARSVMFKYTFLTPSTDAAKKGQNTYANVQWVDSGMRINEGYLHNDPGVDLGMTLGKNERVNIPGFNGATSASYPDKASHSEEFLLPVLWNVDYNPKGGCVDDETGTVSLLVLTRYQLDMIIKVIELAENENAEVTYITNDKQIEDYDYENGLGFSLTLNKDTGLGFEAYNFVLGKPVRESHLQDNVEAGVAMVDAQWETTQKFNQGYHVLDAAFDAGELTEDQFDTEVYAWIARRLLDAWGHEISDDTPAEDVVEMFKEFIPTHSLAQAVHIGQAIQEEEVIKPKRGKTKTESSVDVEDEVDSDNPF